jgi:6-phosphogluconolactonase
MMVGMATMIDRRKFVSAMAIAPFAARAWAKKIVAGEKMSGHLLFVGTQTTPGTSKGIYTYRWNPDTGELSEQKLAAEVEMPTFLVLAPDGKHLYAANETEEFHGKKSGGVTAFAVDGAKLTPLNAVVAEGTGTCYVSTDHTGRAVFCANYNGGSASSFRIEDSGRLSEAVSHFQYHGHGPVADRQEAPHAHRVTPSPDNRYLYVNDLGLDCIHIYKLDAATAKLTLNDPPQWKSAPGSGPRALRFHPNGKFAYCVDELDSSVQVLRWHANNGALELIQKLSLIPENYSGPTSTGCDIVITRDGRHAYAANRGLDRIDSFAVDPATGKLTFLARTSSGGAVPRDLALDPTEKYLLVANQVGDTIAVFARDAKTGRLAESGKTFPLSRPQCLVFA